MNSSGSATARATVAPRRMPIASKVDCQSAVARGQVAVGHGPVAAGVDQVGPRAGAESAVPNEIGQPIAQAKRWPQRGGEDQRHFSTSSGDRHSA